MPAVILHQSILDNGLITAVFIQFYIRQPRSLIRLSLSCAVINLLMRRHPTQSEDNDGRIIDLYK